MEEKILVGTLSAVPGNSIIETAIGAGVEGSLVFNLSDNVTCLPLKSLQFADSIV
jgi:hypothetical protein